MPGEVQSATRAPDARASRLAWTVAVALPIVVVLVGGWQRRWLCDDAFINFRVIDQITAGHGPVFNQGERVEVGTSTLWMALLGLVHVITRVRLEWVALVGGLVTTAAAVAVAAHGARLLHTGVSASQPGADGGAEAAPPGPGVRATWWLPAGALVFASVPVVWDYTTGGLENGLSWLWWAATFALAVRATVGGGHDGDAPSPRPALLAGFVGGLGPLVRPDLALPALAFLVLVLVHQWRGAADRRQALRRAAALVAVAAALPVAYQVFRMGYYGQLLPNTVYAKEGGRAWWSQGGRYLVNLVSTFWLWVPILALVGLLAACAPRGPARPRGWAAAVLTAEMAALGHGLLVVRAGGDYMQGRLLLPALFGLLLPVFVVPLAPLRSRRRLLAAAVPLVVVAVWAVLAVGSLRPEEATLVSGIFDNRQFTLDGTGVAQPIFVEDHVGYLERRGIDLTTWGQRDEEQGWSVGGVGGTLLRPLADGRRAAVSSGAIGALPYRLPLDVYVVDELGLADPVVAHVALPYRGIPGHEKFLRGTWWAARLLAPGHYLPAELNDGEILVVSRPDAPSHDPTVVRREQDDAAAALACGPLAELQDARSRPLTVGRFLSNVVHAPGFHGFRFDADPAIARRELCP